MKSAQAFVSLVLLLVPVTVAAQSRAPDWRIIEQDMTVLRSEPFNRALDFRSGRVVIDDVTLYFDGQTAPPTLTSLAEVEARSVDQEDGLAKRRVERLCTDALVDAMRDLARSTKALGGNAVVGVRSDIPSDAARVSSDLYLCRHARVVGTEETRRDGPRNRASVSLRGQAVKLG